MTDTDLLFQIIAQDQYRAQFAAAQAAVDKMTDSEKQAILVAGQAAQADQEAAAATRDHADASDHLALSITGLQQGIQLAGEAVQAFKQVWDFAKEGASIQRIQTQFDNMAAGAGVNANSLLSALDKAAHGTVDDEALMQTATRALALGLTQNSQDIVKLMEVARASSVAFGGDTSSAFERISNAVENLTPRALKQAGIIVDLNKAYKDYSATLGVSASDLTDEEKRQALLNQVLDKGADLVRKVGAAGDDTATSMQRLEVRLKDFSDTVKSDVATSVDGLIFGQEKLQNLFKAHSDEVARTSATYKDYTIEVARAGQITGDLTAVQQEVRDGAGRVTGEYIQLNDQLYLVNNGAKVLTETEYDLARGADTAVDAARRWNGEADKTVATQGKVTQLLLGAIPAYDSFSLANDRLVKSAGAFQKAIADTKLADLKTEMAGAVQNEMTAFQDKQASLAEQAQKLRDEIAQLEGTQGDVAKTTIQHAMSADQLNLANIRLAESERQLSKETDPLKHAALAAQIAIQRDNIEAANTAVVKYVDNSKRIGELQGQYDKINEEIGKNATAHEEATKRILFGYLEQQLAAKGLTEAALPALDKLSVEWGLKSQTDVTAMQRMMDAVNKFSKSGDWKTLSDAASLTFTNINLPLADTVKTASNTSDMLGGHMNRVNDAFNSTKQPAADLVTSMQNIQTSADTGGARLQDMAKYGVDPLATSFYYLNQQASTFNTLVGQMPATIPTLPPTGSTGGGTPGRPPGSGPQAQHGANFIVPPNPRGGMDDYYPVLTAPGEHVQVTPAGGGGGMGGANISVNLTISGTSASAAEIQAVVYDTMTQVMREAAVP